MWLLRSPNKFRTIYCQGGWQGGSGATGTGPEPPLALIHQTSS